MDPITHAVVGLSIAVLSGEPVSLSNPAVLGCVAGAVIPDIDIVMQIKGDYTYLKNHRGLSHSIPALAAFTTLIMLVLMMIFQTIPLQKVILLTFFGCLSHVLLDITNSYGAEVLWPFYRKKITLDLLLIYDPMLILMSIFIVFPIFKSYIPPFMMVVAFFYYLGMRYYMRIRVRKIIFESLGHTNNIKSLRVLPSMIGLIRWHFIIVTDEEKIIGEINIYPRRFRIISRMENIENKLYEIVMNTPLAEFFSQFTPIFHIECDINEHEYVFKFIDLRYYIARDFLHHATAVINKDLEIVTSLFHPYTKTRKVEV